MNARLDSIRQRYPRWPLITLGVGALALIAMLTVVPHVVTALEPQVDLRTGGSGPVDGYIGCYLSHITGLLIPDPSAGTAIVEEDMGHERTVPVKWPPGYTGRLAIDGQVDVLDEKGVVVARTGLRFELLGGYDGGSSIGGASRTGPISWLACSDGVYPAPSLR